MSRPIGEHIIRVCQVLDANNNPMTLKELLKQIPACTRSDIWTYCNRAIRLSMIKIDRDVFPMTYSVIDGWDLLLATKPEVTEKPLFATNKKPLQRIISSVWDLGAMA